MDHKNIGNGTWGFRKTPLEEQLRITCAMGLGHLELSIANTPNDILTEDVNPSTLQNVKDLYKKAGIPLECAVIGNDFTQADPEKSLHALARVKKYIDTANRLGLKQLRIFAGFARVEEVIGDRWGRMIDCLCRAAEFAKPSGLLLAIETHGGVTPLEDGVVRHFPTVATEVNTMERILKETPNNVTVNWDPANLRAVGHLDPTEMLRAVGSRLSYVHLKDFRPTGKEPGGITPVGCGEGFLDWPKILSALKDYSGIAFIEYEPTEDVENGSRRSLEFLRRHLSK